MTQNESFIANRISVSMSYPIRQPILLRSVAARLLALGLLLAGIAVAAGKPLRVAIASDGVFLVNGSPAFPIGFTKGPPLGATAPAGGKAGAKLAKNGLVFFQWLVLQHRWNPAAERRLDARLQEANRQGYKVAISIADLAVIPPGNQSKITELERVVRRYRANPALLFWKGSDEPQWGRIPPHNLNTFYRIVHRLDPNHPVWITQAPRGTVNQLRPYARDYDVGAIDIYPISYPPGIHSGIANKQISVVGDYTRQIAAASGPGKGLMMTLQICWSGVDRPGKTLRFPTYPQERYMSYQAIIDGARGLLYFGGAIANCLSERDRPYGWNWRFYHSVLGPVLRQFRPQSSLYPALIASNANLPVKVHGGGGLEFTVREANGYIYLLAARREGHTRPYNFTGLPQGIHSGRVLFESPRRVIVHKGSFTDWFAPHDVHVYRFRQP